MLSAALVAAAIGPQAYGSSAPPLAALAGFGALVLGLLAVRGADGPSLRPELLESLRAVVVSSTLAAMSVLTLRVLLAEPSALTAQTVRPWAFATAYLLAGRIALHWSEARARRRGEALRPTLVVGAGRVGRLVAGRLLAHPELGLKPVGFLDKEPLDAPRGAVTLPVLGASWDLEEVVAEHGVEQVIVTFSTAPEEVFVGLVRRCEELGVAVSFVPRMFEMVNGRVSVEHIGGLPIVSAHAANPRGRQFAVKYGVDRLLAGLAVLLLSPVLLVLAAAVWLSMGRPILFRQQRVGRDGRPFEMLKFRTMRGAPAASGEADASWALEQTGGEPSSTAEIAQSDERRTRLGRFLRACSLDELPQLLNVLRGQMSIVGPRPERVSYVDLFEESIYRYGDRHRVKPGITGWAQVHGLRGKTSLADRVEWDNYYIENWSLWLDLKIALLTARAVVSSGGA
jgi:exopolysaccharide biosynthesis polyprenyl glycosylphosphotransferase